MSTFEKVRDAVANELGLDPEDIQESSSLVSLGMDSMDKASLILALEEALGIEIFDDDAKYIVTIRQIVKYADSRCH